MSSETTDQEISDDGEAPAPATPTPFTELGLTAPVLEGIAAVGYETPSPIQARTIPPLMEGRDLLGQAQTGTGKTAAFALPILSQVEIERREPQALVLVPTRELAIQVAEAFQTYAAKLRGFRVLPIYGGQGYEHQLRPLKRGVHVVVGTPGRVMDHMRKGTLLLEGLKTLVLDEADEMLRMGFIEDVEWVLQQTPDAIQIALFSATLPPLIQRIARKHLKNPETVTIESRARAATSIRQRFCVVRASHKVEALTRVLEAETCDGMIVFVRTKTATVELSERLEARGYRSTPLNGDIPQRQREQTIERLKAGRLDILVATDVAARGLDVDRISHVINFDIPHDAESYVHRIGRTGRAGRSGDAILFLTPRERRMLRTIENATGSRVERMATPTADIINERRIIRFKQRISEVMAEEDLEMFQRLVSDFREERGVPMEQVAAALAAIANGGEPFLLPDQPDIDVPDEMPRHDFDRRSARGHKGPGRKGAQRAEPDMETFRIEVGRAHGARHGAIVGAIANEAGIAGKYIGRIRIFDDHSIVDLPTGLPGDVFNVLRDVRVRRRPLRISKLKTTAGPRRR